MDDFAEFIQACAEGRRDPVQQFCKVHAADVNHSLVWTSTQHTIAVVERQLANPRGWFRDRETYRFKYGKGHHVVTEQIHLKRDTALEKRYLYCTSGVRRTGLHEGVSCILRRPI